MHKLDLNRVPYIFVELTPVALPSDANGGPRTGNRIETKTVKDGDEGNEHDKVYIEEIIKEPAFRDERVSQYIFESEGVDVARCRKGLNTIKLDRRWNGCGHYRRGQCISQSILRVESLNSFMLGAFGHRWAN